MKPKKVGFIIPNHDRILRGNSIVKSLWSIFKIFSMFWKLVILVCLYINQFKKNFQVSGIFQSITLLWPMSNQYNNPLSKNPRPLTDNTTLPLFPGPCSDLSFSYLIVFFTLFQFWKSMGRWNTTSFPSPHIFLSLFFPLLSDVWCFFPALFIYTFPLHGEIQLLETNLFL